MKILPSNHTSKAFSDQILLLHDPFIKEMELMFCLSKLSYFLIPISCLEFDYWVVLAILIVLVCLWCQGEDWRVILFIFDFFLRKSDLHVVLCLSFTFVRFSVNLKLKHSHILRNWIHQNFLRLVHWGIVNVLKVFQNLRFDLNSFWISFLICLNVHIGFWDLPWNAHLIILLLGKEVHLMFNVIMFQLFFKFS